IHAEIKLRQVSVEMLGVNVLIHAHNAALEDRKERFKRIGVSIAARPFVFGMIDGVMLGRASELEHRGAIRHLSALAVKLAVEQAADPAMVNDHRADRAAALDKAQNAHVLGPLVAWRAL